jgi:hypothetical protein
VVAAGLKTEQETLLEFHRKGWIATVQRNDVLYLTADQRYRAKHILHLSKAKNLSEEQIELVLSIQQPPLLRCASRRDSEGPRARTHLEECRRLIFSSASRWYQQATAAASSAL